MPTVKYNMTSRLQRLIGRPIVQGLTLATVACAGLGACGSPTASHDARRIQAVYVIAGEEAKSIVRVIVADSDCPMVMVDGAPLRMSTRAAPDVIAQRPTQSEASLSKPSSFPVRVCEATLAPTVRAATVLGRPLPALKALPQRIVVIGDTGCRIKASDNAVQDCSDEKTWPFRKIADKAAAEHPDLVVHVGDYHYRETPCPNDHPGCAGSPWGYGWDAWNADLFAPASGLLAAAPWVVARGNHEECSRAGQGWFRLLDPKPFEAQRSCDEQANDSGADISEPYAVPLGDRWQLIVFDSAKAGNNPLKLNNARDASIFANYQHEMLAVAKLASVPGMRSIFVSHHPILGFVPANAYVPSGAGGNPALLSVMKSLNGTKYFPPGISATLHGHVHLFEAIDFASSHPATIVAGHGGDNLDNDLPNALPAGTSPAEGVRVRGIAHSNSFGYLVMDRGPSEWMLRAKRLDGSVLVSCALSESGLSCDRQGSVD
jgi:hypothetical protein